MAEEFAAVLKGLREKAGLTQAELAKQSGVVVRKISRLETGTFNPSWETVQALADVLTDGDTRPFRDMAKTPVKAKPSAKDAKKKK